MQWTNLITDPEEHHVGFRTLTISSPILTKLITPRGPLDNYLTIPQGKGSLQDLCLQQMSKCFHIKRTEHKIVEQVDMPGLTFLDKYLIQAACKGNVDYLQHQLEVEYIHKPNPECPYSLPSDLYHQLKEQIRLYYLSVHRKVVLFEQPQDHIDDCVCSVCKKGSMLHNILVACIFSAAEKYPTRFQDRSCLLKTCQQERCRCHQATTPV